MHRCSIFLNRSSIFSNVNNSVTFCTVEWCTFVYNCTVEMYTGAGSFSLYRALTGGGELSGSGLISDHGTSAVHGTRAFYQVSTQQEHSREGLDLGIWILRVFREDLHLLLTLHMWHWRFQINFRLIVYCLSIWYTFDSLYLKDQSNNYVSWHHKQSKKINCHLLLSLTSQPVLWMFLVSTRHYQWLLEYGQCSM